jgi:hypothetical protein
MIEPMVVIQVESEGGYLVPEFIWKEKPGTRAWAMRTAGRILGRPDIRFKGMERHEFAAEIYEILKQKNRIEAKFTRTLPK